MLGLFKKSISQVAMSTAQTAVQVVKGENYTVEQIHDDFDTASQKAVDDAKKIITDLSGKGTKEQVDALIKAGFKNVPAVVNWQEQSKILTEAEKRLTVVEKYQAKYPNYKFIFMDQVKDICKKYGLLCAPVGKYKGSVPQKNLQEIASFSVKDEDKYLEEGSRWGGRVEFDFTRTSNFRTKEQYKRLVEEYERHNDTIRRQSFSLGEMPRPIYGQGYLTAPLHNEVPLFICAPKSDLIIDKDDKEHDEVFISKEIKDPIVLHYVGDGFLIVTKWGLEGDDPSLVNEKMN